MKFAVLSFLLPPSASGMTVALNHLLKGFSGDDYCLISQQDYDQPAQGHSYMEKLPGKYICLPVEQVMWRGAGYGLPQRFGEIYIPLTIRVRARRIARILRREGCEALVACTGGWDCLNLPAGYLASRMVGIPYYAYIFDYYSKQWEGPNYWGQGKYLNLARRMESALLKGATGVIAPNEFLRDAIREDHGVESQVIHNPCDLSMYETLANHRNESREASIVYTGDIYDAHFDAFINMTAALARPELSKVKLHAYTIRTQEYLRENGITGPLVLHPHVANDQMPRVQRDAHILFLALAFHPPYPEGIRTAAPGKMGEYLASGTPILVHAPPDSFVSWYFRQHQCGLVVDTESPDDLAAAIKRLLNDGELRRTIVTNAMKRANEDFSVVAVQRKFRDLLGHGLVRAA